MSTLNVVKFKVKPGQEEAFLDAHRAGKASWNGLQRGVIMKTGENAYCLIGEWANRDAMVAARPAMIATLDSFRATLDEAAEGKGVTDAVSGDVVLTLT
jgi:quinol monooxygenase YgiN